MVISVPGEFYVFEAERIPDRESLNLFFKDLNENDILELRINPTDGSEQKVYHVS